MLGWTLAGQRAPECVKQVRRTARTDRWLGWPGLASQQLFFACSGLCIYGGFVYALRVVGVGRG